VRLGGDGDDDLAPLLRGDVREVVADAVGMVLYKIMISSALLIAFISDPAHSYLIRRLFSKDKGN
jgi:hypothetical protein